MTQFRPKYITFDCYGTLTWFQMSRIAKEMYADRVPEGAIDRFVQDFNSYRYDEILGDWKPYKQVIMNAVRRTCALWDVEYLESEAEFYYNDIPNWGPHPDVAEPLARVAEHYPLVILSNASNDQIQSNVDKLGAPFHAVYTAQQAQAYKPRFQAFEYMLDQLDCGPEDLLHVSASLRYDLQSAYYMHIDNKVYVNRGYEPSNPAFGYHEIPDIGGLPGVLGL